MAELARKRKMQQQEEQQTGGRKKEKKQRTSSDGGANAEEGAVSGPEKDGGTPVADRSKRLKKMREAESADGKLFSDGEYNGEAEETKPEEGGNTASLERSLFSDEEEAEDL